MAPVFGGSSLDTGHGHGAPRPAGKADTDWPHRGGGAGGSCWSDGRYGGLTHNASDGPGEFCEKTKKFSVGPYLRTEFRSSPSTAKNLQHIPHLSKFKTSVNVVLR